MTKGTKSTLILILICLLIISTLCACNQNKEPTPLDTPIVTVNENGLASWQAVAYASSYLYKIDGGEEVATTDVSVLLQANQRIEVKAIPGNKQLFEESQYSQPQVYFVQLTLAQPDLTIDSEGFARWEQIPNAVNYTYVIDNGEEQTTTELFVQLQDGQKICVRADGDDYQYANSQWSATLKCQLGTNVHIHVDQDENKKCDICQIDTVVNLTLLAINDFHGMFEDGETQPGVDELTTYIKSLYADDSAYELLVSSGDMWQGSAESGLTKGAIVTEWMNQLGFASMTLGNHEFDWGAEYIRSNASLANFPLLGINIIDKTTGQRADYAQPSVIVERGGAKIGIIGSIGNIINSISGEFNQDIEFLKSSKLVQLVQDEAKRLREEEGCNFIVYSKHNGDESESGSKTSALDNALTNKASGKGYVDIVLEAHSHKNYIKRDNNGVYYVQAGSYNSAMSSTSIQIDIVNNTATVEKPKLVSSSTYGSETIQDDEIVDTLMSKYFPEDSDSNTLQNPYTTVLGNNSSVRSSNEIADMVAKLMLDAAVDRWQEHDIVVAGGTINVRSPYSLYQGEVTYAQIYQLLTFDNRIVLCTTDGFTIKSKFGGSGLKAAFNSGVDVSSLEDDQTYYVVVDTYTAYKTFNNLTVVEFYDNYTFPRDLVADYISRGGWSE